MILTYSSLKCSLLLACSRKKKSFTSAPNLTLELTLAKRTVHFSVLASLNSVCISRKFSRGSDGLELRTYSKNWNKDSRIAG